MDFKILNALTRLSDIRRQSDFRVETAKSHQKKAAAWGLGVVATAVVATAAPTVVGAIGGPAALGELISLGYGALAAGAATGLGMESGRMKSERALAKSYADQAEGAARTLATMGIPAAVIAKPPVLPLYATKRPVFRS